MQNSQYTEQELLGRLAKGEKVAIEQLYKTHYRVIAKWVTRMGGTEDDAADLCQESIIVLYEKVRGGGFSLTAKVNTYLVAVARNLWYKKMNGKQATVTMDDGDELEISGDYTADLRAHREREEYYKQLDEALAKLGQPCSKLLRSFYFENASMQQIASELGYTNADNAKTQKYKCLSRLKKLFYSTQVK